MNLLFVCSQNKLRSATAEAVFSTIEGIAAIGCGTDNDAVTTISGDLIEWADIIFVMENTHRNKVNKKFKHMLKTKKMVCLAIPDIYDYMDIILISELKRKVSYHVNFGYTFKIGDEPEINDEVKDKN